MVLLRPLLPADAMCLESLKGPGGWPAMCHVFHLDVARLPPATVYTVRLF